MSKSPHLDPTHLPPVLAAALDWLRTSGVRITAILVVALVVSWIGALAVRRMRRRLEGSPSVTQAVNLQRATTVTHTLSNAVLIVIWVIAILMILDQMGINLAPLLAGAGVLGVALGFGAQSLVRDFLAGFFFLLEDQFGVGDWVDITAGGGTLAGRIESLTLRRTSVRATDGTLYTIGNGSVMFVANKSRGRGKVTVEVTVPAAAGVEAVERRLDRLLEELRQDPGLQRLLSSGPSSVRVEQAAAQDEVVVTVSAETRPSRREEVEEELQRTIRRRMTGGERPPLDPDALA